MISTAAKVFAVLTAAVLPAIAGSPTDRDTPKEAAYVHTLRFKVLEVESVEKTATHNLVKVRVQRWYGKIDQRSRDLHKKYDTQEFSFLFPAAPNIAIKVGDIIDYRLVGYLAHDK